MTTVAPAATVILLRDAPAGLEVLLLRRSSKLAFHGGAWVFPGGRVDPGDHADGGGAAPGDDAERAAARRAAAREAREEAGLAVDPAALLPFSHWTTPVGPPRRFATWFFAAAAGAGDAVVVDGGEIHDHAWLSPAAALDERAAGRIELPPPTFVTLTTLREDRTAAEVLDRVRATPPPVYVPRIVAEPGGASALYPGDAGWEASDPAAAGARHRLVMREDGWRYLRAG